MQSPSALEIEREVAALRDIRRRSSQQGPGSIPLDPDLPPNGIASASAGGYWDNYGQKQTASPTIAAAAAAAAAASSSSSSTVRPDDQVDSPDAALSDDPSHLFWVPAHLHPELAPGEFRAFLKEHTTAHPDGVAGPLSRSFSGSSGLGRKKSMLSKQYKPALNDRVEDETVVTVKRNRSSIYSGAGPQLTIGDLQKLEELAEEAAKSDDPSKLRSMLRRSLSLNVAPSFIDQMDDMLDGDDADSPIIVPRPGQILRRSARTKIRKAGLAGDGGGHRFPASRRIGRGNKLAGDGETSSDNGHDNSPYDIPPSAILVGGEDGDRPLSYSDEAFILDAYGDRRDSMTSTRSSMDDDDGISSQSHSTAFTTTAPTSTMSHAGSAGYRPTSPPADMSLSPPKGQTVRMVSPPPPGGHQQEQPMPMLRHPTPQRHLEVPHGGGAGPPSRTPSPTESETGRLTQSTSPDPFRQTTPSHYAPQSTSPVPSPSSSPAPSIRSNKSYKEKEKKGLLKGMWGGDKKKERERSEREKAAEASRESREREGKDKDGGFFGSLFGGKKKHEETEHNAGGRGLLSGAGPAAAAALLGASKTKNSREPSPGPGALQNSFARYPIHVERAVYRLSHIKLANPRRPLYEQVLISNLMFWYLGVINKVTPPVSTNTTGTTTLATQGVANATSPSSSSDGPTSPEEKDHAAERERLEKEKMEREREEKERVDRERMEVEARDRDRSVEKESRKRGTLVKSPPPGSGAGRRAEMPVRGPQYDIQHQMMEQERGPAGYSQSGHGRQMGRSNSTPIPPPEPHRRADPYHDPRNQHQGRPPHPHQQQHPHHNQNQNGTPYSPQQYHQQQPPYSPQQPYPNQVPQGQPGAYMQYPPTLPPGAMAPPSMTSDQWLGSATSRDSPYAAAGGPGTGPVPGQIYPGRSRSPTPKGYPNGPGPAPPANGPQRPPGRSASAGVTGGGAGGPPQMQQPGPARSPPHRQQGPPPQNVNGGWVQPPHPQQRRGPSPQPPAPADRVRANSAAAMDDVPLAFQQQQQRERGGPIVR